MPRHFRTSVLLAAAALLPLALTACGSSAADDGATSADGRDPDTLVIAAIPSEDSTSLAQRYEPIMKMLEDETGKKVELQKATSYAAVIEAQRAHKADIAFYGPLSYVVAKNSGVGLDILAAPVKEKGGDPGYQSFGFTLSSAKDISGLADFKGKKVCFVDETSTSGYLYPKAGLTEAGLDEDAYTKVMAGGHDASVLSVASGDCEAGFATDDMVGRQLIEEGKIKKGQLKTVWKSAVIPGSPVAVSTDLTKELRNEITDAFGTKANADYLKSKGYCDSDDCLIEGNWGYVPVKDADYDSVRDVCAATKDEQCQAGS
ncbi:phosphate/phosphite/phosphonate ABC transporter substrate-binding protein [Streptomyces sp. NPDC023723]|uniref:phosphate/phosphite/phosphonate ABC transporter substrate-binding protein n=1 Tax=Streptomyces sp. NPDC023723 TaxID=3154323 RepID=UPI0034020286